MRNNRKKEANNKRAFRLFPALGARHYFINKNIIIITKVIYIAYIMLCILIPSAGRCDRPYNLNKLVTRNETTKKEGKNKSPLIMKSLNWSFMNTINHGITANKNISRCSRRFVCISIAKLEEAASGRSNPLPQREIRYHLSPMHIFHSSFDSHFLNISSVSRKKNDASCCAICTYTVKKPRLRANLI